MLCNVLLGLSSPFKFEIPEYKGYDITKLRDNCRFLEVLLNRGGSVGGLIGLFFDGAVCTFAELPLPDDRIGMGKVYIHLQKVRNSQLTLKAICNLAISKFKNSALNYLRIKK